jgi:hypothetical protein
MSTHTHAHSVLFIGSAPPRSAAAVFEAISEHVGGLCRAVPDGDQDGRDTSPPQTPPRG